MALSRWASHNSANPEARFQNRQAGEDLGMLATALLFPEAAESHLRSERFYVDAVIAIAEALLLAWR